MRRGASRPKGAALLSLASHPVGHHVLASVLMSFLLSSLHLQASPVFRPFLFPEVLSLGFHFHHFFLAVFKNVK